MCSRAKRLAQPLPRCERISLYGLHPEAVDERLSRSRDT
jgi:hypothetical protein